MKSIKFYDTSSLLIAGESAFKEKFAVSSITFKELEHIKSSSHKDAEVKYSARLLTRLFDENPSCYEVVLHRVEYEAPILKRGFEISDDMRILADAYQYDLNVRPDETIFVTNDLCLKHIANCFFGEDSIMSIPQEVDDYKGFIEVCMTNEEMADFYTKPHANQYNLHIGEYILIKDMNREVKDFRVWTGEVHRTLKYNNFDSSYFGKVKPYKADPYQQILFDSLENNPITLVRGPAGSGKTFVSLAYLLYKLEHHDLDKIIVFCNTVATANSAKLGYYPGTKDEKLLDSQIGNLLSSKLGDRYVLEQMIQEGKLQLLPMSDIRGFDTSGMRAGVYISEAQNLDRSMMKLALQRIGKDCICIIDGDSKAQVDDVHFSGNNNGMKRVSTVFRGKDIYGEIELQNIYRSKIADIAEYM